MLGVNVNGGTNAGSRIVRHHDSWQCSCVVLHTAVVTENPWTCAGTTNPVVRRHHGDRYSCPDCGARRP